LTVDQSEQFAIIPHMTLAELPVNTQFKFVSDAKGRPFVNTRELYLKRENFIETVDKSVNQAYNSLRYQTWKVRVVK